MKKKKSAARGNNQPTEKAGVSAVRRGGTRLKVENSGLEVWLYDEGHLEKLRDSKALDFMAEGSHQKFVEFVRDGIFVGYSLWQDDQVDVAVYVGDPLTEKEMSVARWLEPQTAFLRLPTGKLLVVSNDANLAAGDVHGAEGGVATVPPGDYRLTLYRIDYEALRRESIPWDGPQEVIVLTPGGTPDDAAADLLPFKLRRDTSWVGKYSIQGKRADVLAWFPDRWDTFVVNLDSAAVAKLSLTPGAYLRAHVPVAGVTMIFTFARSWDDARRLPPPAGVDLEEFGYASISRLDEWDMEALFCRRERSKLKVEEKHQNTWLPGVIEIIDAAAAPKPAREVAPAQLATKDHYYDPGFMSMVLSEVLPEIEDEDEVPLAKALDLLDKKFKKIGLTPQGDRSWTQALRGDPQEMVCRLYTGLPECFGAIVASAGTFEVLLLSELKDGKWVATGLGDDLQSLINRNGNKGFQIELMDEPLPKILSAHKASLKRSRQTPVSPASADEATAAFGRFIKAAFDQ